MSTSCLLICHVQPSSTGHDFQSHNPQFYRAQNAASHFGCHTQASYNYKTGVPTPPLNSKGKKNIYIYIHTRHMDGQNIYQIECLKLCQIECKNLCQIERQIECQNLCQIGCHHICQYVCKIDTFLVMLKQCGLQFTAESNATVGTTRSKVIKYTMLKVIKYTMLHCTRFDINQEIMMCLVFAHIDQIVCHIEREPTQRDKA